MILLENAKNFLPTASALAILLRQFGGRACESNCSWVPIVRVSIGLRSISESTTKYFMSLPFTVETYGFSDGCKLLSWCKEVERTSHFVDCFQRRLTIHLESKAEHRSGSLRQRHPTSWWISAFAPSALVTPFNLSRSQSLGPSPSEMLTLFSQSRNPKSRSSWIQDKRCCFWRV